MITTAYMKGVAAGALLGLTIGLIANTQTGLLMVFASLMMVAAIALILAEGRSASAADAKLAKPWALPTSTETPDDDETGWGDVQ